MKQLARMSRRARWAVPAGAVIVVGGVLAGSGLSVAPAAPAAAARPPAPAAARAGAKAAAPAADRDGGGDFLARPAVAARHLRSDLDRLAADRVAHDPGLVIRPAALPVLGAAEHERERHHP